MSENTIGGYSEENIKSLDWKEHIRLRPGMYIGKLGDGSSSDDGIYILVKEVLDNCIDEHTMGYGKEIFLKINEKRVEIRDFGRGIPLGKVMDCVSKINTGGKYDSSAFQKSVGLNGVGIKAVNALSDFFKVQSFRDGKTKTAEFQKGEIIQDPPIANTQEKNGTLIAFEPDESLFKHYKFIPEYIETLVWNYAFLNSKLSIYYNEKKFTSPNGLLDLLKRKTSEEDILYPIIHLKGEDIELSLTHSVGYGEQYYSYVNGQYTTQGGTHLVALKEALVKTIREFYKKDFVAEDIREGIVSAVSIRIQDPVFESQTKTKLGSQAISPDGISLRSFINDFVKNNLDNFLHKNPNTADALLKKILLSERERKEIAGIKKIAAERAKKANLHNKKLRDCRIHMEDTKNSLREYTTLFITEGDSASGSITKSRDVQTQAVFSLRGKPLNCFGLTKKIVYENEEFNLLQHALNIEDGIDAIRYKKIVIATDADVDGMHIRLLLLTFFLQFFPDLVRNEHLFILETPLFRIRNKKETFYCYSEGERVKALQKIGAHPEITRFKGLGEISPDEFKHFIGKNIRIQPVIMNKDMKIQNLLDFYMGKNTSERQNFIIANLRLEKDVINDAPKNPL